MQRVLAKKYAHAFLNVLDHTLTLEVMAQIEHFVAFIEQRKTALFYLQLALVGDAIKKESLLKVLQQFKLESLGEKLIELLLSHKRLFLIPEVFNFIVQLAHEQRNMLSFKAESSHELAPKQINELKKFLASQTGKNITLSARIDKTLIAGIRLISPTFEWEHSIRKQLRALSHMR